MHEVQLQKVIFQQNAASVEELKTGFEALHFLFVNGFTGLGIQLSSEGPGGSQASNGSG